MADELINKRIPELDPNAATVPGMQIPAWNPTNDKTERIDISIFLPSTSSQNFEWLTDTEYETDDVVTWDGKWWQAVDDSENVVPGTDTDFWVEVSKSPSGFVFWQAGVYTEDEVFVLYDDGDGVQIYQLIDPARPYVSTDFETELGAGDWQIISEGQTHFKGTFASEAALDAAFPTAEPGDYALVDVGSADAQLFIWDDTDSDWIASGVTTVVPPWDATTPGIVEQSTTAEAQNIVTRTAAGSSNASNSDARTPSEKGLVEMLLSFLAGAWTWAAQQIFTSAPRFSSVTASQFLKVDSSKDLTSVGSASQSDMITGTDDTKPATAKSVEDKGSVKTQSISNSATGTTNIDCLGRDQFNADFTTTVTGNITITKSGDSNLTLLNIGISITGGGITITFPSDTRMDRGFETVNWNQSTKTLTVSAVGTADVFEFSLKKSRGVFVLRYGGPARA